MKAIGYIRVSTEQQAAEGISLDNQRQRIEAYCSYRSFDLAEIIEDAGVSGGKNRSRAGFIDLLDRIEAGDVDVVVLYSLERLSRDMLTLLALERLLDERDVELHTVEGAVDTATPDGWMSFAMKSFLGEMERRQIRYRTKRAMQHKKSQGAVVGAVPFGYRREGDALVIDAGEQVIIETANRLYGQGIKLADICKELGAIGFTTRSGKAFTAQQVKRILEGYQDKFHKSSTKMAQSIRAFIESIG